MSDNPFCTRRSLREQTSFIAYLLIAGLATSVANGAQSAQISGSSTTISVPSALPFKKLGSTRIEARFIDWTVPTSSADVLALPGIVIQLRPSGELCAIDTMDGLPAYGGLMCADVRGL